MSQEVRTNEGPRRLARSAPSCFDSRALAHIVLHPIGPAGAEIRRRIAQQKSPPDEPDAGRLIYPAAIVSMLLAHLESIRRRVKGGAGMLEIGRLFDRGAAMAQAIDALTAGHCGGFRESEYRAPVETNLATQKVAAVDVVASKTRNVFTPGVEHDVLTAVGIRDLMLTEIQTISENVRGPVSLNGIARQFECASGLARIWRAMSAGERQPISRDAWSEVCGAVLGGKSIAEAVRQAARSSRAKG